MASPRQATGVRLVLIDDDSGLETVLARRFDAAGWDATSLPYAAAPEELAALRLHVALVNPALTGLRYLETLAERLPGLALVAISPPVTVSERVRGLRGGADDWVTKPAHPEELMARVEAVLRRRRTGELPRDDELIVAGQLEIRPDRFDVYGNGRPAALSRKEFELVRMLAAADGRVLEREDIYQRVWGYTMARGDRSVDVFVRKLRNKLEVVSPGWTYVHTHFGVGYRFAAEGPDGASADRGTTPSREAGRAGRADEAPPRDGRRTLTV
jgi:DNA-binding response OmpR family regulator